MGRYVCHNCQNLQALLKGLHRLASLPAGALKRHISSLVLWLRLVHLFQFLLQQHLLLLFG